MRDWELIETDTSPRRTRKSKPSQTLQRISDKLQLTLGDSIRFHHFKRDEINLGIIFELEVNVERTFVKVFLFKTIEDLKDDSDKDDSDIGISSPVENEVIFTPLIMKISLSDMLEKVEIDCKTCRYCIGSVDSKVRSIDFDRVEAIIKSNTRVVEQIKKLTRYGSHKPSNETNPFLSVSDIDSESDDPEKSGSADDKDHESNQESDQELEKESNQNSDLDSDLDSDSESELDSDSDSDESVIIAEFLPKRPRGRPRKHDKVIKPKGPRGRPRKYPLSPIKPKGPIGRPRKNRSESSTPQELPSTPITMKKYIPDSDISKDESLRFIQDIMGTKKVVINKLPAPNFSISTPRSTRKQGKEGNYQLLDTYSQEFNELKQKLHTATKLQSLPCREDEFTSLYLHIEQAISEESGCCLYISGTPGVGKTATIREVMSQLTESSKLGELNDFSYVEINALKLISPTDAYEYLWRSISGLSVAASHAAMFLDTYFKSESEMKKPVVVMVDELDQFATSKQNVMYNFFNWPSYSNSKLIVIAVANTMDLPERVLSNKISSRLGLKRLQFIGYTFEQLSGIIEHRLELISSTNNRVKVSKDAINFASRKVASVSGDARRALQIIKRAVEMAELDYSLQKTDEDSYFEVKIVHISKAINETINSPIAQYISTLSFSSKLLLVAILLRMKRSGLNENPLGDIIDEINQLLSLAQPPVLESKYGFSEVKVRNGDNLRIDEFRFILLELAENGIINSQNIKSERYKLISLNVSHEEVMVTLRKDPEVSRLL